MRQNTNTNIIKSMAQFKKSKRGQSVTIKTDTIMRKAWKTEEDELLTQSIKKHGFKWKAIANDLPQRNASQCAQRYKRLKPDKGERKKQWSLEEDAQLNSLVKLYPNKWSFIASQMVGRKGRQIRERYINHLNPEINNKNFSKKEDRLIWKLYNEIGSKWSQISQSLIGRPENMIKNRFYSYIREKYGKLRNPYYIVSQPKAIKTCQSQESKQTESTNNLEETYKQSANSIEQRFSQLQFKWGQQLQLFDSFDASDKVYIDDLNMESEQVDVSNSKYQNQMSYESLLIDNQSIDQFCIL